jgi:hypothetical protein
MPRSGTSLMMRMLDLGGIPVLTDGHRAADEHNPCGYFEDERVKRLRQDASWLAGATGNAVKIIYRLLLYLPPDLDCRVIFMKRDIDEIYASQQAMLEGAGDPAAGQGRDAMIHALSHDLRVVREWLATQTSLPSLDVPYAELVGAPKVWITRVADFLDNDLDASAMLTAIDPALYRHRRKNEPRVTG